MAEIKVTDAITDHVEVRPPPPEIPRTYAKYFSLRDWKAVDYKKSPNIEIIKHLTDSVVHDLRIIYPTSAAKIAITIAHMGQMQLIMLMRILCLSAATAGFSNMDITITQIKEHFSPSSLERDAWMWFDNVCMNPNESLRIYIATLSVNGPVPDYVSTVITEDMRATDVRSVSIAPMSFSDDAAQCAVQEVIDFMKSRMIKIAEAIIEFTQKPNIQFSAADISAILRSTWRGGNINRQFYSDLGTFAESFGNIKKYCKAAEAAAKPKRGRKSKSG